MRRDGRFIERVGFYNPVASGGEQPLRVAFDRVEHWTGHGAQMSPTVEPPGRAGEDGAGLTARRRARGRVALMADAELARRRPRGRPHRRRLGREGLVQGPAVRRRPAGAILFHAAGTSARPAGLRRTRRLPRSLEIREVREHGDGIVALAEGVADRNAPRRCAARASSSRGRAFRTPATDEFYWVDLIGLEVVNREGVVLGRSSA